MSFSKAVQWWEEQQLRVLVLTSLFLQYFLLVSAPLRKRRIPAWFRFLIWLAYLGSDAVAIYALATLFNRHRAQHRNDDGASSIQALWAPILLVHLGGQDGITAYNIEDNELWRRHVLTAMSQVTVAIYVFCKTWSGEKRILQSAILLFIYGTLKCLMKPWDLKRVSINSLVDSSAGAGPEQTSGQQINSLREFIRAAASYVPDQRYEHYNDEEVWKKSYDYLFVDLAPPYSDRLSCLKHFLRYSYDAHGLVRSSLSVTFDRLYTKQSLQLFSLSFTRLSHWVTVLRIIAILVIVAALLCQNPSHGEQAVPTDVTITQFLLVLTVILEYLTPMLMWKNGCAMFHEQAWPDQVAQYNLIGYLARNRKHRNLRKVATVLVCKDYLDQLWCMNAANKSSHHITELIYGYLAKGWKEHHIMDMATYRAFNDNRGHWTLEREGCGRNNSNMERSLRMSFDRSVLLWHLATDFCFHLTEQSPPSHQVVASCCREMSNYMVYLLFVNPEMLMTGARRSLFKATYKELKDLSRDAGELAQQNTSSDENELTGKVIEKVKNNVEGEGVVYSAWALAEELVNLREEEGEEKMWRVVQGVWVEMLCFSAGRCRGYLHAKSLGKGGEYLSYVWLLLLYMGMETLAERMQRADLEQESDAGNIA